VTDVSAHATPDFPVVADETDKGFTPPDTPDGVTVVGSVHEPLYRAAFTATLAVPVETAQAATNPPSESTPISGWSRLWLPVTPPTSAGVDHELPENVEK